MEQMAWTESLEKRIQEAKNPICLGIDPVIKLIPAKGNTAEEKIRRFYFDILEEAVKRNVKPAVIKPNSAYFERISIQAMFTLAEIIDVYKKESIPVILDAKRGDIGKSSAAYADAAFDVYKANAVTVSPWMGSDSVLPFTGKDISKGVYILLRTSNPGAKDFQDAWIQDQSHAFYNVAEKLTEWDTGNIGAVVGATNPEELERITNFFASKKHEIPFLIPGVSIPGVPGGQGGDAKTVLKAIAMGGGKRNIHVLNSSSGLNFAWQRIDKPEKYATACLDALESLIESIA